MQTPHRLDSWYRTRVRTAGASSSLLIVALASVVWSQTPATSTDSTTVRPRYKVLGERVSPDDSLSAIRYFDTGHVSINDRCPVRRIPLGASMKPLYVNGKTIGFC